METIEKPYLDKWCARTIRKVSACKDCLHYDECKSAGHSIVGSAIEHNKQLSEVKDRFELKKKRIEDIQGKYRIIEDDDDADDINDTENQINWDDDSDSYNDLEDLDELDNADDVEEETPPSSSILDRFHQNVG